MQRVVFLLVLLNTLLLSGCFLQGRPMEVQQGNVIVQQQVNQLHPGMSKAEVRALMGTPVLESVLDEDRYDYVYTYRLGNGVMQNERVTLYFAHDRLVRYAGALKPKDAVKI